MHRSRRSLPSYQHHRASGQARVRLNGVDHYLGPHGTVASKREYDRLIAEWLTGETRSTIVKAQLTVSALILQYWRFAEPYYVKNGEPTSELHNVKLALKPLHRLYGVVPVHEVGPLAIKAIRQTWIADGITRGEINKRVGRLVREFRWGVENELVDVSVY